MISFLPFELVMYLVKILLKVGETEEEEVKHYCFISQVQQMEKIYNGEVYQENLVVIELLHKNLKFNSNGCFTFERKKKKCAFS